MRIVSAELRDFKGITGVFELSPVTLVCGPNGSGKTAITDAIAIGTVGYHPRVGKTNPALFKFGSGTETGVTLRFDTGATNKVTLTQDADGSVKCEKQIGVPVDPVLLDIREFLNMTGAERTKLVVSKARLKDWKPDAVIGQASALEANLSALGRKHVPKIVATMRKAWTPIATPTGWLDLIGETCKVDLRSSNDTRKRLAAYLGATKVATVPPDVSAAVTENDAEQDRLKKELTEFDSELASYKKQLGERDTAKASLGSTVSNDAKRADIQKRLQEIVQPDLVALEKVVADAKKVHDATAKTVTAAVNELMAPQKDRIRVQGQLAELATHSACPFCKQSAEGWQHNVKVELEIQLTTINSLIASLEKKRDKQQRYHKDNQSGLVKAEEKLQDAKETIAEIASLRTDLNHLDELAANRAKFEAALNVELQEPNPAYREQLQKELAALVTVRGSLSIQNGARATYLSQVAARSNTETELEGVLGSIMATEAVKEIIDTEQKRICSEVFATLLATAAKFTDGILESNLEFTDAGLGRRSPSGVWISHDVFSGREMLLAYAGLSVALAQEGQFRIVMLDECGRLDALSSTQVAVRLDKLVRDGVIDQAIMIDVDGNRYPLVGDTSLIQLPA